MSLTTGARSCNGTNRAGIVWFVGMLMPMAHLIFVKTSPQPMPYRPGGQSSGHSGLKPMDCSTAPTRS